MTLVNTKNVHNSNRLSMIIFMHIHIFDIHIYVRICFRLKYFISKLDLLRRIQVYIKLKNK